MEMIYKPTGERVTIIPWIAGTPRPWGDKYERVMFRHAPTSRSLQRVTEKVVAKGKLKSAERNSLSKH